MNAWQVTKHGHYNEVLEWGPRDDPKCPDGGVVIDVAAAAVNYPDLLAIAGLYQVKSKPPFVPGLEAVGKVSEAGPNSKFKVGQRVVLNSTGGAFAEKMAAADLFAFAIPDEMSDEQAAGFFVAYQTSYFALTHRAALREGETLLVHGGAGGVGTSAIQIGKHLGARVIATASSAAKLEHCTAAGADEVINYKDEDWVERVKALTDNRGADVIYDPVGGDVTTASTKCIAWNGRLVIIGFASGSIPKIAANRVLLKNIAVVGLHWGNYFLHQPELVELAHEELLRWFESGSVKPIVSANLPMSELAQALASIEKRTATGKVVVTC